MREAGPVEVVHLFGSSVIDVRVCTPRRSQRLTSAVLIAGTALLVSGLVCVALALDHAADNRDARAAWTAAGKPAYAFRPRAAPPMLDAVTIGGVGLGLALLVAGAARRRRWPSRVLVGDHALIAPDGDALAIRPAPDMEVERRGRVVRVRHGQSTFLIAPASEAPPIPTYLHVEARVIAYHVASAAGFLLLWLVTREAEVATWQAVVEPDEPELVDVGRREHPLPIQGAAGDGRPALAEGRMGSRTSDRAEGRVRIADRGGPARLSRAQALEAAATAGILGSDALAHGDAFGSLLGSADLSSAIGDEDLLGGVLGDDGAMSGGFGLGASGFDPGGGGTGWGTIASGDYGTTGYTGTRAAGVGFGEGGGRCGSYVVESQIPSCRGRRAAAPNVRIGQASVSGGLDKATIRRHVKRRLDAIGYCYERHLLAHPGTAGTIDVTFFILANGHVAETVATGLAVEITDCVETVIESIEFPRSDGGTHVSSYPFTFYPR